METNVNMHPNHHPQQSLLESLMNLQAGRPHHHGTAVTAVPISAMTAADARNHHHQHHHQVPISAAPTVL
jgi:hypothetical protein